MGKADRVMNEMMRSGFDMTTKEFYQTTLEEILKKYCIEERLTEAEYQELLKLVIDRCAENDLKNTGIEFFDYDDLKYK